MSTVQVVGIGIATVILVALVFSLIITRRKDAAMVRATRPEAPPVTAETAAFLFEPPRDDLHMMGKQDAVVVGPEGGATAGPESQAQAPVVHEQDTLGPEGPQPEARAPSSLVPVAASHEIFSAMTPASADLEPAALPPLEPATASPTLAQEEPHGPDPIPPLWLPQSGIEPWATQAHEGHESTPAPSESQAVAASEAEPPEAAPAARVDEIVETPPSAAPRDEALGVSHEDPETAAPAEAAEPEPATVSGEAPQAAADEDAAVLPEQPRPVALSDIIVTTNDRRVDLADPEVRRMLKDLAKDEIDLAAQYRELGQTVDALMQLTEAEHICTALGMTSHTKLIQQMIRELQA